MQKTILSYAEAAELLGIVRNTLYSMVRRKRIPHVRLGSRLVRFRRAELEAWMEARSVKCLENGRH